jgi:two-component system sensor histidine kinase KdpD
MDEVDEVHPAATRTPTRPGGERIVVALPGGPRGDALLQRAVAARDRCGSAELLCVHVVHGGATATELAEMRQRASSVGTSLHVVVADDVADGVLQFARDVGATRLMLGTARRPACWPARSPSWSALRAADGLDVHLVDVLVDVTAPSVPRATVRHRNGLTRRRRVFGALAAFGLPAVMTIVCVGAGELVGRTSVVLLFVLATVGVALIGGMGAALVSVVVSGILLNYFLTPPFYEFASVEAQQLLGLALMLVVAVLVALVVHDAARRRTQAVRSRAEAALLSDFAATVMTARAPLHLLLEKVREAFGADSVALLQRDGQTWRRLAGAGPEPPDSPHGTEVDVSLNDPVAIDGPVQRDMHLVLTGRFLSAGDRRVLRGVAGQALLAVRAQQMAAEAAAAERRAEMTELRSALLSAVGHDLRTPLTAIKAAVGSLRDPDLHLSPADSAAQLATADECADRLQALVDNLLDSARLATGAVQPQLRGVGYDDVLARALSTIDGRHLVDVQFDDTSPMVLADPGLLERVVANLLANALTHGRASSVRVGVVGRRDRADLIISDRGPGIPADRLESVFAPFQRRGDRDNRSGVGLGLAVARGFTEAMAGTLHAEATPGGGLTTVVSLPTDPAWPLLAPVEPDPTAEPAR